MGLDGKVDAPELFSGPVCEIQEVSRVGAQGVTSKSKLLAREMPRVCSRGLRGGSGEACRRKGVLDEHGGLDASSSRGKGASGLLCGVAFGCEGMCM